MLDLKYNNIQYNIVMFITFVNTHHIYRIINDTEHLKMINK